MLYLYATDYLAMDTGLVSKGARLYCKAYGHAHWILSGEDQGICPRCLAITETETANAESGE